MIDGLTEGNSRLKAQGIASHARETMRSGHDIIFHRLEIQIFEKDSMLSSWAS
jgi:hypothetical protein